ncbi:MAG: transposase [Vulcanimicrobiota bacterium]
MARKHTTYTKEYKQSVLALLMEGNRTPREVANSLGIPPRTVQGWAQAAGISEKLAAGAPIERDQVIEMMELREKLRQQEKQIRTLEMEREILKKAAAFFAKEQL